MRNAFADEITQLAGDPRVVLLSADIGNRLFDKFKAAHPNRFYNTGIAEANTIGLAAGLASCGLRPICYTIAPFITSRCYEQIKLDVAYHEKPVVIVGTGAGLSYASLGPTHHSLEDIALMRTLPGMQVLAPADSMELRACLRAALASGRPAYIRIGKKGEPVVFPGVPSFEIGRWISLREGGSVAFLSTGNMLPVCAEAADQLRASTGIEAALFSCASIKPLDCATLADVFARFDIVVTAEEHSLIGGFGSAVADWMIDECQAPAARLLRFGAGDEFLHESGEQDHGRAVYGLTARRMCEAVQQKLSAAPR
jgi:transketolase